MSSIFEQFELKSTYSTSEYGSISGRLDFQGRKLARLRRKVLLGLGVAAIGFLGFCGVKGLNQSIDTSSTTIESGANLDLVNRELITEPDEVADLFFNFVNQKVYKDSFHANEVEIRDSFEKATREPDRLSLDQIQMEKYSQVLSSTHPLQNYSEYDAAFLTMLAKRYPEVGQSAILDVERWLKLDSFDLFKQYASFGADDPDRYVILRGIYYHILCYQFRGNRPLVLLAYTRGMGMAREDGLNWAKLHTSIKDASAEAYSLAEVDVFDLISDPNFGYRIETQERLRKDLIEIIADAAMLRK